jgi:hypothetical protein
VFKIEVTVSKLYRQTQQHFCFVMFCCLTTCFGHTIKKQKCCCVCLHCLEIVIYIYIYICMHNRMMGGGGGNEDLSVVGCDTVFGSMGS